VDALNIVHTMSRKSSRAPGTPSQACISTYFSQSPSRVKKRPHDAGDSTIDLTSDSPEPGEQPSVKRLKVHKGARLSEQWRFDPSQPPSTGGENRSSLDKEKRRRHEEFKRVLLGENSVFARRKSAQESTIQSDVEGVSCDDGGEGADSDRSDAAFKELTELFSHKPSKGKGSAPSAKQKKRAQGELGPSGQPYTPAELQASVSEATGSHFCDIMMLQSLRIIRENPGVVLMIESGYKYYFYGESATVRSLGWTVNVPI